MSRRHKWPHTSACREADTSSWSRPPQDGSRTHLGCLEAPSSTLYSLTSQLPPYQHYMLSANAKGTSVILWCARFIPPPSLPSSPCSSVSWTIADIRCSFAPTLVATLTPSGHISPRFSSLGSTTSLPMRREAVGSLSSARPTGSRLRSYEQGARRNGPDQGAQLASHHPIRTQIR